MLVFLFFEKVEVKREKKFGGNVKYDSYAELEKDFLSKKLHPMDLKQMVGEELAEMFEKIR